MLIRNGFDKRLRFSRKHPQIRWTSTCKQKHRDCKQTLFQRIKFCGRADRDHVWCFHVSGFRSPLSLLHYFITVFLIIWVRTEHIFVIWTASGFRVMFCTSKNGLNPTHTQVVFLLTVPRLCCISSFLFFFDLISGVYFVLFCSSSLILLCLGLGRKTSTYWCLGRSVLRDCGISWVSLRIF